MANTYTQIHLQLIFAVQNRISIISNSWEDRLYMYITGIIQNHQHKVLAINGMLDHIHILIGMRPNQSISDLLQDVKGDSSRWINENKLTDGKFSWQEGFGAFSYSKSQVSTVANYIEKQKQHHRIDSFINEYKGILLEFEVGFNERYLFTSVEY